MNILSYGAGTNSTAIIVGMWERGETLDAITFADTGGEKPHTYQHIDEMNIFLKKIGFPLITRLRGSQPKQVLRGTLENECLELKTLPSKVFGFSRCSEKWKIDPQNKFNKHMATILGIRVSQITQIIGFDADEPGRAERSLTFRKKNGPELRFPLIEWGWGRKDCVEAIERAGINQPGKSSCFFCPSSKKPEILQLSIDYPDLYRRALAMEDGAKGTCEVVKGLGRRFSWREVVEKNMCEIDDSQTPGQDCGCYD